MSFRTNELEKERQFKLKTDTFYYRFIKALRKTKDENDMLNSFNNLLSLREESTKISGVTKSYHKYYMVYLPQMIKRENMQFYEKYKIILENN